MRTLILAASIGFAAAVITGPASSQEAAGEDLFARDLKDWSRTGDGKSPWRLTTDRSLFCMPANDMFIPEREFTDGAIEFEYRFKPTAAKTGYKGRVGTAYAEGTGFQLALGDECGDISVPFQGGSDRVKTYEKKADENPAKKIGEWNRVVLKLSGKGVSANINGKEVASFSGCDSERGLFAFEAQGSEIEFRNVKWREAK